MALDTALRFEAMAADESIDDHAQHQQHGADQRLTQCGAGVAGRDKRGNQRNADQHQGWYVPEGPQNRERVIERAAGQAS
ncbi:hypothetical protein D3C76_1640570 [compost metagenome]